MGCLMSIATYLVVSRAPSPKTVICVRVPCVSGDMHGEGGRWLSRDHLYLCRHPHPPGLEAGHWSSPSGPPITCSLWEPDWQHWESSRRQLPGYCFLIRNGVVRAQAQSGNEWNVTQVYCLCCLRRRWNSYMLTFGRKCRDAYSQDMPVALTRWLPWLPLTHSPAWNSGPG